MANFTSVQSGDWNDGATWGHTSPGVKGTDWPGLAGDTFTIAVGHLVKYNVVEANELGASTVNGTLYFPLNADTKLTFGHVDFTIGATGVFITSSDGTVGNIGVVDKAFTCSIIWNTTGDNLKGIVITNGAYVDMRGDTTLYGGIHATTLAANWSAGQTLTATGTAPLSWVAGQTFTIARNTGIGVATTLRYTIASVAANGANTDITISEAAPVISFVAGGQIFNEARNVRFYKLGAETPAMATVYTNRPKVTDNHVTGMVKWTDVQFTGFYFYDGVSACTGGTYEFTNTIHRNSAYGLYRIETAALTGCNAYSNTRGFYNFTHCTLNTCNAYSNTNGFYNFTHCTLNTCNAYSNGSHGFYSFTSCTLASCTSYAGYYGFDNFTSCTLDNCSAGCNGYAWYSFISCMLTSCNIYGGQKGFVGLIRCIFNSCNVYSNTAGIFASREVLFKNGTFGWNGLVSAPNTSDIEFSSGEHIELQNVKAPNAGYAFTNRNSTNLSNCIAVCDEYNQSPGDWRAYAAYGTITKVAKAADFDGDYGCKVEPLSNCVTFPMYFFGGELEIPVQGAPFYLPAGTTQVSVKVQVHGFTVMPTNAELYFEVEYYNTATSTLTTATSTTVVDANDATKEFTIAVTPNRTEKAFIRGVLKKYESGAYVLSDTMVKINGSPIGIPIWSYGLRPSADPARVLKYWG